MRRSFVLLVAIAALTACGTDPLSRDLLDAADLDGGGGGDAATDTGGVDDGGNPDTIDPPDTGVDTVDPPDTGMDTIDPPDIGVDTDPPDTSVDIGMDTAVDVGVDTSIDAGVDTGPDADPDTGCTDECRPGGRGCEGNVLVSCELGASGCFELLEVDCADFDAVCDPDTATCDTGDPCPEPPADCDAAGDAFCDGDARVLCTLDATGCLVRTEEDCSDDGLTCVERGARVACGDICGTIDTCPAESYCDGGAAVNCAPDANGCLVERSREDCATDGGACVLEDDGFAACDADACAAFDVCDPDAYETRCDGAVFLSCELNGAGCFVESGENCSFRRGGFCDVDEGCLIDLCGDGEVNGDLGETCDDQNRTSGDGCSNECQTEDGFTCYGEPSECERLVCGDDVIAFGEGCEDGNERDGDGCSSDCYIELPERGDRLTIDRTITSGIPYTAPNEGCTEGFGPGDNFDAFWAVNNTGSTQSVSINPTGEGGGGPGGFFQTAVFAEPWRPGVEPDFCLEASGFGGGEAGLRDFTVEPGQVVAIVVSTFGGGPVDYTVELSSAGCGDGRVQSALGEVCDDGGRESGDGCSATCTLEDGFACEGEPSECYFVECGDGRVAEDAGEECDDANDVDLDGCTGCIEDDGALCYGEPSICVTPVCGDDVIELGEGCEDGNTTDGDGCSSSCEIELPPPGTAIEVEDTLDSIGEYARPGQGPSCGGGFGGGGDPDYPWEALSFTNTSDVRVVVDVVATWSGDGYLFVYEDFFDPSMPLDRCLFGDDDDGALNRSAVRDIEVDPGETIVVVASSFGSGGGTALGPYTLEVTTR